MTRRGARAGTPPGAPTPSRPSPTHPAPPTPPVRPHGRRVPATPAPPARRGSRPGRYQRRHQRHRPHRPRPRHRRAPDRGGPPCSGALDSSTPRRVRGDVQDHVCPPTPSSTPGRRCPSHRYHGRTSSAGTPTGWRYRLRAVRGHARPTRSSGGADNTEGALLPGERYGHYQINYLRYRLRTVRRGVPTALTMTRVRWPTTTAPTISQGGPARPATRGHGPGPARLYPGATTPATTAADHRARPSRASRTTPHATDQTGRGER